MTNVQIGDMVESIADDESRGYKGEVVMVDNGGDMILCNFGEEFPYGHDAGRFNGVNKYWWLLTGEYLVIEEGYAESVDVVVDDFLN